MINFLIWISLGINVAHGGASNEMFSSRCWRERESKYFGWWRHQLDNNILFIRDWKEGNMNHCESCYYSDINRAAKFLQSRKYTVERSE